MKYLCVLLTKYPDRFARVLARLSGQGYTHASIGLEDGNRFYSFSFRGFTEETPDKLRRRGVTASRCYRIPVADGAYRLVETRLRAMAARREDYSYSYVGVALCLLRLPFRWKNRYFCSQFVAELLSASGAVSMRKAPSLYLPNHFPAELDGVCQVVPSPV